MSWPEERPGNGCGDSHGTTSRQLAVMAKEKEMRWKKAPRIPRVFKRLVDDAVVNERRTAGKQQKKQQHGARLARRRSDTALVTHDGRGVLIFHGAQSPEPNDRRSTTR